GGMRGLKETVGHRFALFRLEGAGGGKLVVGARVGRFYRRFLRRLLGRICGGVVGWLLLGARRGHQRQDRERNNREGGTHQRILRGSIGSGFGAEGGAGVDAGAGWGGGG